MVPKKEICLRKGYVQVFRVTLGKAAGKKYLLFGKPGTVRKHRVKGFLFGAFDKSAGIDDDEVRGLRAFRPFPAGPAEKGHQGLGVNLVFYTAKGVKKKTPGSLSPFAHKISKNRLKGGFLPCKLPKDAGESGFYGTRYRKNPQVPQAPGVLS
jgi:hypothetical protein